MNYYNRYPGDYSRDTATLSLIEHGAYALLLDTYYATEKPLPVDKKALYRICRASTAIERKAIDSIVAKFFTLEADGLHNARADQEITDGQARINTARANGRKKGGGGIGSSGTSGCPPAGLPNGSPNGPPSGATPQHQHQERLKNNGADAPGYSPDDYALAEVMFSDLRQINPRHKEPSLGKWAVEIRLMRERDGRSLDDIRSLWSWANAHHFWKTNILSPATLRKQWDRLTIQKANEANHAPHQPVDNSAPARVERAIAEQNRKRYAINGNAERVDD